MEGAKIFKCAVILTLIHFSSVSNEAEKKKIMKLKWSC